MAEIIVNDLGDVLGRLPEIVPWNKAVVAGARLTC